MRCFIVVCLLSLWACTASRVPQDHFVLRGTLPGAQDSTRVSLLLKNARKNPCGFVINGKFEIRGTVEAPTTCLLRVDDKLVRAGRTRYRDVHFFIENGNLEFSTPHIDSLSEGYHLYDLRKEKNYMLKGSSLQDAYHRYQLQTLDCRYAIEQLEKKSGESQDPEDYRQLRRKRDELQQLIRVFIRNQRNLVINLHVAQQLKRVPFTYEEADVEVMERLFASYQDTCQALREYRESLREEKNYVTGKKLEDAGLVTPDGKKVRLLEQLNRNGYTFIDFWASWCGPCRKTLPAVKEMYKRYGERVKFVSVAVWEQEEAWQKAMKEENMPWLQLRDEGDFMEGAKDLYRISSIPTLLVISPEGKIVFRASRAGEIELFLKNLKEL